MGDCDLCGGPVFLMGVLGNLVHSACRNCGMQWSERVDFYGTEASQDGGDSELSDSRDVEAVD